MTPAATSELRVYWARVILAALMTGSALGLYGLGALSLHWGGTLAALAVYAAGSGLLPLVPMRRAVAEYGQIMLDVGWVFAFVWLTGGSVNNSFSLLFFLAIIAASNVRFVRGAIAAATLSSLAYAAVLTLDYRLISAAAIPGERTMLTADTVDFFFSGYIYAICFYLVAALSGFLAERVRLKGRQLELASQALEDFRLSTGDILEKMGSGLLTLNGAGQIRYCNAAGAQIIGLAADRLAAGAAVDVFTGGLSELGQVLARELAADGHRAVRREITVTRPDGTEMPVGISTTPIAGEGGSIHGLIAIFQDLSEVKQNESRQLEMEQLESMRELTAALLTLIKPEVGMIDQALRPILDGKVDARAAQSLAAECKQRLDTIVKTADDYIRFARIEPGGVPAGGGGDGGIIGASPRFAQVMAMVRQIAPSDSTVLICGESGTGKELLARELHRLSHRSAGPFVCINCAALPETLLESELFGHVRGSFTGAVRDKEGLFRVASGGTVFLDEVSETSPAIQVKLLRVLQEREIVPVGGTRPIKVDVRLVSATNVDLARAVEQGKFRTDLFYRINVIPVNIPPLRDRPDDIPLLVDHFLRKTAAKEGEPARKLSAAAHAALLRYRWPGNVRELENLVERTVVLASGPLIERSHLPQEVLLDGPDAPGPGAGGQAPETVTLKVHERQAIVNAIREAGGNKSQAARDLGIHYATLYRKMRLYGIK